MPIRHEWLRALRSVDDVVLEPACSAATVATAASELGPGPVAWALHTSALIVGDALPTSSDQLSNQVSAALRQEERGSCEACVLALLCALYAGHDQAEFVIPAEVLESNQRALRRGTPFSALLHNAWEAHGHLQQSLMNFLVDDNAAATSPEESLQLAADLNRTMTAYFNTLWQQSTAAWQDHQRDWEQHAALAKRKAVTAIIDQTADVDEAQRVLGVRLTAYHVAIIVGPEAAAAPTADGTGALHRALVQATAGFGAQTTLVDLDDATVAAWLSFVTPATDQVLAAVRENLARLPAAWCTVGPALAGARGFRRSHLVAMRLARRARARTGGIYTVTSLSSVGAASLLAEDDDDFAGWFVRDTLGDLVGSRPKDDALRETLFEYLSCGRSLQLVAEKLHVAPNTVAYRVKQAQQLLSQRAAQSPFDVMLALSLARDLPDLLVAEH